MSALLCTVLLSLKFKLNAEVLVFSDLDITPDESSVRNSDTEEENESSKSEEKDDKEFGILLQNAKKNMKRRSKEKPEKKMSFQQQILDFQQEQLRSIKESDVRLQETMFKMFENQRKADEQRDDKNRSMLLELGKLFAQK